MGSLICVSPWLHDLSLRDKASRAVAVRIMRAQILIEKRQGHVLQLDTEYARRAITYAARYGRVARVQVECARCRWQAWLGDWVRGVDLTPNERQAIIDSIETERDLFRWVFLRKCAGDRLAAELLRAEHAPALKED